VAWHEFGRVQPGLLRLMLMIRGGSGSVCNFVVVLRLDLYYRTLYLQLVLYWIAKLID
jgi:hypothetical protein